MATPGQGLRRGFTTGACATAALKAALDAFWGAGFPPDVTITLPRGETPTFAIAHRETGADYAEVGITKDAGDDPDVTHGALIIVRVSAADSLIFEAGEGVGHVTMPGLPVPVGEPAINPVPREMMRAVVTAQAARYHRAPHIRIRISIPGGAELAKKTWNPRLGILGGLSILGTTGIVRPFSCAAWIASIHRGIDVARAAGLSEIGAATGATSEATLKRLTGLPDHALIDMGDFVGGMVKYLRRHPVERLTLAGGLGKLIKLAQGASDLHSARSQIDFARLAERVGMPELATANTALMALDLAGPRLAEVIADDARTALGVLIGNAPVSPRVLVISRQGDVLADSGR